MADPYRRAAEHEPAPEAPTGDLMRMSVSGRKGRGGERGHDGDRGSGGGGDGGRGGDAGPAQSGEPGGTFEVRLAAAGDRVLIEGKESRADGVRKQIRDSVELRDVGDIVLLARGGDGGLGGQGGTGGDGARGTSGSNASRYSSGGDGGPGGDGGDGGNGSDGGAGAAGGSIQVSVAEQETHLLMLVRASIRAGAGGGPGANGRGGAGGAGGSGGSSYSWTESESYTDSQGRSQSRTTHHSNSGGSSGRGGRVGTQGQAVLQAGAPGQNGRFRICVAKANGGETFFEARYDLDLNALAHESENADGVHEPGERIFVKDIRITNSGGMPTPSSQPTVIELCDNEWVEAETKRLELPRSLERGETMVLPGPLTFLVRPVRVAAPGEAFAAAGKIVLDARIPAVKRSFERFAAACPEPLTQFAVRYPLQLSPMSCLHSMAPGESARLEFVVRNVSKKTFGEQGEIARSIGWTVRLAASQVGASQVQYEHRGADGESLETGIRGSIVCLHAGQETTIIGTLTVSADAPTYEEIRLRASLELGGISAPGILSPIHLRDFSVRVAERFTPDPTADVLLVVHNRTTREDLDAWRAVAADLGLKIAVWDVGLEGHLDIESELEGGSLAQQFSGKPIVVLDDSFDTGSGEQNAYALIEADDVLRHCVTGGSAVVVGSREMRLDWSLMPCERKPSEPEPSADLDDDAVALVAKGLVPMGPAAVFVVHETKFFGIPAEHDLELAARKLTRAADMAVPGARHVATFSFEGEVEARGFPTRFRLGTVTLERTLDTSARGIVSLSAPEETMRSPERIASTLAPLALAVGLPPKRRLIALRRALEAEHPDPTIADGDAGEGEGDTHFAEVAERRPSYWLRRAFCADIARETIAAGRAPGLASRPDEGSDPAFPELAELAVLVRESEIVDPRSPLGSGLIEGMAVARASAWALVRWWMLLPPLLFFFVFARAMATHRRARSASDRLFDQVFPREAANADERRALARRLLRGATRSASRAGQAPQFGVVGRSCEGILEWLVEPLADAGWKPPDEGSLVVSDEDRKKKDDARSRQARRRAKVVSSIAKERADKLIHAGVSPAPAAPGDAADQGEALPDIEALALSVGRH